MIDSPDSYPPHKKTVQTAGYNYSTTQLDICSALSEILSNENQTTGSIRNRLRKRELLARRIINLEPSWEAGTKYFQILSAEKGKRRTQMCFIEKTISLAGPSNILGNGQNCSTKNVRRRWTSMKPSKYSNTLKPYWKKQRFVLPSSKKCTIAGWQDLQ